METEMVGMATRQPDPVTLATDQGNQQRLEEPKVIHDETCVTSGEEQPGLREPPIVPQSEQIVTAGNEHVSGPPMMSQGELVTSGEQLGSESLTPQEDHQGLDGILQHGQSQDESLDKPQDTQYEHIGQQNNVVDEVVVSNVTEISTTGGDRIDKTNEEVLVTSENQDMVSQVFISSKLTQSNPPVIPSGRFSLQDLICGLLAQNQASIAGVSPGELKENPISSAETTTTAVQTDSTKQNTAVKPSEERATCSIELEDNQEKKSIQENAFDANSVALFLGEMAQRNGKKRRISSISKSTESETKLVSLTPGAIQKWNILTSSDAKGAKFRKIQPKDIANVQEEITICEEEKEEMGELRGEAQCRYI